jgi:photosystem II stability/assembly factor-like uncharacterized protein
MMLSARPPDVELLDAWTANPAGEDQQAYLPGDPMQFRSGGMVNLESDVQAHLRWTENGPCGARQVFSDTVTLNSGDWIHSIAETAPECTGIYSSTVHLRYNSLTYEHNTKFVVNQQDSDIQLSVGHGFDRCYLPSIEDMQTWMDESPYSVFNLYIGGISFACKDDPVDAVWIYQAAQQGWAYILTWVGPQAPCTGFTHRMSYNQDVAYAQGKEEAEDANAAAIRLGFQGNKLIYYDLEGYSGANQRCKDAVHEFMRGWVERLHELETGAGGYGGACSSFISEWAEIVPPPDDVWIAHWYRNAYYPDASVWQAPCVSDGLWVNSQRTKQYAGGHAETWGGERLVIDSNKFEGKTVVIPGGYAADMVIKSAIVERSGPNFQSAGLVAPGVGWAVVAERLYWSADGGSRWTDITPAQFAEGRVLGVEFRDEQRGVVVGQVRQLTEEDGRSAIEALTTQDGGRTWRSVSLVELTSVETHSISEAYVNFVDGEHIFVVLKLQSGSSFSVGRLFASQDGGNSWEERTAPGGDPVYFLDGGQGWMTSGPAFDALFRTQDGGWTWQRMEGILPVEKALVGLPWFDDSETGWLPVIVPGDTADELQLYSSRDGGKTWEPERGTKPGLVSVLESNPAWTGVVSDSLLEQLMVPEGAVWVDFSGDQVGWAVANTGDCQDGTSTGPGTGGKRCSLQTILLTSEDGGLSWNPVCSADQPCSADFNP